MTPTHTHAPTLGSLPRGWDRLGVLLSGLCAVHCLLMPLLLVALPLWNEAHALHEVWHPAMAVLLLPVTLRAAHPGRRPRSAALLYLGLGLVWLGVVAHEALGEAAGIAVTLVGSLSLIAGHLGNLRCGCAQKNS